MSNLKKWICILLLFPTHLSAYANPRSLTHFHPAPPLTVDGIQYQGPQQWIVYIGDARLTPQNPTLQGWTVRDVLADRIILEGYGEEWVVLLYPKWVG